MADGPEYVDALSSDGRRVLEAELGGEQVEDWIARARRAGADALWLHTNVDLTAAGFERFPGYVRMRTEQPSRGEALRQLAPEHYAQTLDRSYRGLWGHKLVASAAEPPPGAVVLGLYEEGEPIGLCTVFTAERLVDGPGVIPERRNPDAYTRLLLGACAYLGDGATDLDSWGDEETTIAGYAHHGFAVVERTAGWELRLR